MVAIKWHIVTTTFDKAPLKSFFFHTCTIPTNSKVSHDIPSLKLPIKIDVLLD